MLSQFTSDLAHNNEMIVAHPFDRAMLALLMLVTVLVVYYQASGKVFDSFVSPKPGLVKRVQRACELKSVSRGPCQAAQVEIRGGKFSKP